MLLSVIGLLGIFTFGFFVADILLGRKAHILERIAVGFLLGSGIFTFVLFLANWKLNIPFGLKESLLILLSLNLIAFLLDIFFARKGKVKKIFDYNFNFKEGFENLNSLEKIIIGLILFLFFSSLIHNIYWPVADWDALTLYDFRARVFAQSGFMDPVLSIDRYYLVYPLATSLLNAFVYVLKLSNPSFVYTLIYVSFVISFFFSLRRHVFRFLSIIFTFAVATSFELYEHSLMSYANLPYTVYYSLGFIYLYLWSYNKKNGYLFISSLLTAISIWVRDAEPFWLVSVLVSFYLLVVNRNRNRNFLLFLCYCLPLILFGGAWKSFVRSNYGDLLESNLKIDYSVNFFLVLSRFLEVFSYFFQNVIRPRLVIVLILTVSTFFVRRQKRYVFGFSIFLIFLMMFAGAFLISFFYPKWHVVGDSLNRMSMVVVPMIIFWTGLVCGTCFNLTRE